MKRILLLAGLLLMLCMAPAAAAVEADPVILNLTKWYHSHPLPASPGVSGTLVFKSPRAEVFVRQATSGTTLAPHYHNTVDEFVYIVEGSAELMSNREWVKLKAGDVHVNPRGAVHALKVTDPKGVKFISVFTPPQPTGGDVTAIPDGFPPQAPATLMDANPAAGIVVSLKEWQSSPIGHGGNISGPITLPDNLENDGLKSITIMETPRSVTMLREAGYGAFHHHRQDLADEIVIVVSGSAQTTVSGKSYTLGKNDLQIIPMGADHHMKLMLGENIRFITLFALPPKQAGSKPAQLK